jgi:N-acetylglutamate synthase-like GNAT family acetyltransferase
MSDPLKPRTPQDRPDLRLIKAGTEHFAAIRTLVESLELSYPSMDPTRFWILESEGEVLGAAELKEFATCSLLSCVGVREDLQGRGLGRMLVNQVVKNTRLPVFLYTLIPGFFASVGFAEAEVLPSDLPPRSTYGCIGCDPSVCRCMVRVGG